MNPVDFLKNEVVKLFIQFNNNYGSFIDISLVNSALENIIVVDEHISNISDEVKTRMLVGAKALSGEGKIYINENVTIDVLFHEILHFITEKHMGLMVALDDSYTNEEKIKIIEKYGMNRACRQVEQLNESMTRFITELAIPDVEIKDSYKYGADALRRYFEGLLAANKDYSFMFNMYFKYENTDDIAEFKKSFGNDFEIFINNIEIANNFRFYLKRNERPIKVEELNSIIDNALNQSESR